MWWWGAVSFSRVYQALGFISDFTQGKSKPSAAVDSGEVESAHYFLTFSQKDVCSLSLSFIFFVWAKFRPKG